MTTALYETDFFAWTERQAALLRQEEFAEVDLNNLIEEIESLGRSEKREILHRLEVLILHLLKWQWQPEHQSRSWRSTIIIQRRDLKRVLRDNPTLHARLAEFIIDAYPTAADAAFAEMQLLHWSFPVHCPYRGEQILDDEFWPTAEHVS